MLGVRSATLAGLAWLLVFAPAADARIKAFVSIAPQAYLAERVGGSHVSVDVLVGPGQNHHTFEPTPRQMVYLAESSAYFAIGLPFERRLLQKIREANPNLECVDTREGIALRMMEAADEDPGPDRNHDHERGAVDPHVWLNPLNAKIIAANICKGLKEADPAHAADYGQNLDALQDELDALHARIAGILAPFKGRAFYVYHPAFGYFADAYGLRQVAVEIEGKEPTPRQLAQLISRAKADGVRVIFVQQQFPKRAAEAVAQEIQGAVVSIDPLSYDYIKNLGTIAEELRAALQTN